MPNIKKINLSSGEYHAYRKPSGLENGLNDCYWSSSVLKQCGSYEQFIHYCSVDREETDALKFGTTFHTMTLKPYLFNKRYAVLPDLDMRYKESKDKMQLFLDDASDKGLIVIPHNDKERIDAMVKSIQCHPLARVLLDSAKSPYGEIESSYFMPDFLGSGLNIKVRPDALIHDLLEIKGGDCVLPDYFYKFDNVVIDIKTNGDMRKDHGSIIERFGYDISASLYKSAISEYYGGKTLFVFIFVDTFKTMGANNVKVVMLDDYSMKIADGKLIDLMTNALSFNHMSGADYKPEIVGTPSSMSDDIYLT